MAVNGTCAGSAFCGLGCETVAATAECTAAGWNVTDDGCYPAGCSKMPGGPSYDPTFFADCPLPGHINQVCTPTCKFGNASSGTATAVCRGRYFEGFQGQFELNCYNKDPEWIVTGACKVDVCQAGTAEPPGESGPVMYKGKVYPAADIVLPDSVCGCFSSSFTTAYPPVAVFRIEAAAVKRAINVSTCGVDNADGTYIEVRRIDDKAGTCSLPSANDGDTRPVCSSSVSCGFQDFDQFEAAADFQYIVLHYSGNCNPTGVSPPTNITISQRFCGDTC